MPGTGTTTSSHRLLLLLLLLPLLFLGFFAAQGSAQSFAIAGTCNSSVGLSYNLLAIAKSFPYVSDPAEQPYAFWANLEIFNAGEEDLRGWEVFIGYVNREILVAATGALLADSSTFPVNASNGVTLAGTSTLKTGIETANDIAQMGVVIQLKGTEFGKNQSSLPSNITLVDSSFQCSEPVISVTGQYSSFSSFVLRCCFDHLLVVLLIPCTVSELDRILFLGYGF
jgi:hypothetical protein